MNPGPDMDAAAAKAIRKVFQRATGGGWTAATNLLPNSTPRCRLSTRKNPPTHEADMTNEEREAEAAERYVREAYPEGHFGDFDRRNVGYMASNRGFSDLRIPGSSFRNAVRGTCQGSGPEK